jgi:2,3-bisphosphoglycerate-independent phosphoglycerate mutase
MDRLARQGRSGLARTVPEGYAPGSDVANLSVLGYDPARHYTGRAPLEAAAMNVRLGPDDIAFRCNFVTIESGLMKDYSAGQISSEEGRKLIAALAPLMPGRRLYSGVSYRNLLVLQAGANAVCTPPHDISDRPVAEYLPRGPDSELLIFLMEAAGPILEKHPVNIRRMAAGKRPANAIWLWGQGPAPAMPSFARKYSLSGTMISAVDLLKGIGRYAGLEVIDVPGASGTIDTNYQGKVDAALLALQSRDYVYLHEGEIELKVRAIEIFDEKVVGPVLQGLEKSGEEWRVLLMPDHATPIAIKTHSSDPVPFTIAGSGIEPDGVELFDEAAGRAGGYGLVEATELVGMMKDP